MSPRSKLPLIYLDKAELVEVIRSTRKQVQHRAVHPPSTKARLVTSHKQAYKTIDDLLWLAEIVAGQTHGDTFPDEWKQIIEDATKAVENPKTPAEALQALELVNDFTEFKGCRIPPDNILNTVLNGLRIK